MEIKSQRLYFPLLDSTRFIAFIPVFLTHCFVTNNDELLTLGWYKQLKHLLEVGLLGLDYFFVLSSFLITRLIIEEVIHHQKFHFFDFFIRRSLRIWPIYFLMVAIGFTLNALDLIHKPLPALLYFVSFTLNLYIANYGFDFLFFLVFLWSISVEEQFYLGWGTLLALASRSGKLVFKYVILSTAIMLIIVSLIYRVTHKSLPLPLYFNTLSVCGNFGVGILLAWFSAYSNKFIFLVQKLRLQHIIMVFVIVSFSAMSYTYLFNNYKTMVIERFYFSLLFAAVIAILCYSEIANRKIKIPKSIDYLGKISLGLYFYHGIAITGFTALIEHFPLANNIWQVLLLNPLIILAATIVMAAISYRYLESPVLQLKQRFYPQPRA